MKYLSKIIRFVMILLSVLSLYFLLLSSVSLKISNTHEMAEKLVDQTAKKTSSPSLKSGIKLLQDSGLEEILINGLPRKFIVKYSYADIYHLTSKYDREGKISANDIGLKSENKLEEVINDYIVKVINLKLNEESQKLYHVISIYRYSIFVIILLYILAIVLIWLKRYSASIPLLIGSVGTFSALLYFCQEANFLLQTKVYDGIVIRLNGGIWLGLAIGVIVSLVWPILLKYLKKVDS